MKNVLLFPIALFAVTAAFADTPIKVKTQTLDELVFNLKQDAPATVIARNHGYLSAELNGIVLKVHAEVGDFVKKGSPLVTLDCRLVALEHQQALAQKQATQVELELSESRFKRSLALFEKNQVSEEAHHMRESETKALEARIKALEIAVASAKIRLEDCTINAPYSGYITQRLVNLGELLSPGVRVFRIMETEAPQVSAMVRSSLLDHLKDAPLLRFQLDGQSYGLEMRRILPNIDPTTRSYEVRLVFTDQPAPPGASGRLVWTRKELFIPAHLLVKRNTSLGVFLFQDGQAVFHPLTDATEGSPAVIDLPETTKIITEGRLGLQDQDKVAL